MRACIDACSRCHQVCLETAMNHCDNQNVMTAGPRGPQ